MEGIRGLLNEGGSSRIAHFKENIRNLGGIEAAYFAFGAHDVYAIMDLPENISSAAISLALNAGGGFRVSTVVLLTAEEMDKATKKTSLVDYHPPNST